VGLSPWGLVFLAYTGLSNASKYNICARTKLNANCEVGQRVLKSMESSPSRRELDFDHVIKSITNHNSYLTINKF